VAYFLEHPVHVLINSRCLCQQLVSRTDAHRVVFAYVSYNLQPYNCYNYYSSEAKPAHTDWPTSNQPYAALVCRLMVSTPVIHGLLLIYRPRRDGRLSCLVGWPAADTLVVTCQPQTRESPPAKERRPNYWATPTTSH